MKNKIAYVANAQLIGCLLVIFGHSYPFGVEIPYFLGKIREFIYIFHIPLFVLISGFLLVKSGSIQKYGPVEFVKRRAVKLIIPYLIISAIGYFPKYFFRNYINDDFNFSIQYFIRAFLVPRENIWGHFWFIPMIFLLAVLSIWLVQFAQNHYLSTVFLIIFFLFLFIPNITGWLSVNDIKNHLFYYFLGMLIIIEVIINKPKLKYMLVIVSLPLSILLFLSLPNQTGSMFIFIRIIIASLMILFVLNLSNVVHFEKLAFFKMNQPYIYPIFILSWPYQALTEILLNKLLHFPLYIVMICMFLAGIAFPIITILFINRIEKTSGKRFLSIAVGL